VGDGSGSLAGGGGILGHKEVPVTHLRRMMLEEPQRRNYAQSTVKGYLRIVQDFAQHFHQPPDKLGPEQLRQYQAHLFQDKKLNAGTVQQYVAALRFFFNKTLKRRYPLD
jgi:integrase/recombinase XerD